MRATTSSPGVVGRLKRKGLVETRQGSGTFVSERRKLQTIDTMRYVAGAFPDIDLGVQPDERVVARPIGGNGYEERVPPAHIADAFGVDRDSSLLNRKFVLDVDGTPRCLIDSWENPEIQTTAGGRFAQEPWHGDVVGQLKAAQRDVTLLDETFVVELGSDEQTSSLRLSKDDVVIVMTRHAYDDDANLVEIAEITYPAFHTMLRIRIPLRSAEVYLARNADTESDDEPPAAEAPDSQGAD